MDEDPTVRLRPPLRRPVRRRRLAISLAAGAAVLAAWWAWPRPGEPPAPPAGPPQLPAAEAAPPLLDFEGLARHAARVPTAQRWEANPLVWVLDFPTLELQGMAMNRAAALLEKAATPRDRVLDDAALAAAIAADSREAATWYFGHNYRASDLARFFTMAARDGVRLNPQELWVRSQAMLAMRLDRGRESAILSLPGLGPRVDEAMRRAILTHELGHGQFFTLPFAAAHVMRVWQQGFTEAERAAMRRFLAAEGYDTSLEELMANEAMAYLVFTPDPRFFDAVRDLGWSPAQAARLRAMLREGLPDEPAVP